jgi:hypothetical protein
MTSLRPVLAFRIRVIMAAVLFEEYRGEMATLRERIESGTLMAR